MKTTSPSVINAMTVDVEDYFHANIFEHSVDRKTWDGLESRVVRNTERLLEIFAQRAVEATFFVLGWVAERYPALVRRIAESGHEVASHGFDHQLIYAQTPDAFRQDVRRARERLEDASGVRVVGYRAPSFSIVERSRWALDVLIEEGYEYDASIFPIRHDRYGIPSSPRHLHRIARPAGSIVEVPGSTVRVGGVNLPVAGGGYFRLLPYAWTRWGMERVNARELRPAIFYLHPWEIDPGQPRLPLGRLSRVRHYKNLDRTEARLERLLADFRFASLRAVMKDAPAAQPAVV